MADEQFSEKPDQADAPEVAAPPQYGVGPFSVREAVLGGVWLLAFLFSFFSLTTMGFASVWSSGLWWVLTIGAPTLAVFLVTLRRLSPSGIPRFGSLGIDQFASVAFSVSALVWAIQAWDSVAISVQTGFAAGTWVIWIELVLAVGGVFLTVVAPHVPVLRDDFVGRRETPAHRLARPPRPIAVRPAQVVVRRPAPPATAPQPQTVADGTITEVIAPLTTPGSHDVFWALAPDERVVHDETGAPLFVIGPTAWALVVEDRGGLFVIRHEDGRIGYLHDVTGVTRG